MITYMYKIAFKSALRDVGLAAALGIVNVLMILVAVRRYICARCGGGRARPELARAAIAGAPGRAACALALLSPYVVMLLTALKPEARAARSPRRGSPRCEWRPRQLPGRRSAIPLSGLAPGLAGGGRRLDGHRAAGRGAGRLLHRAPPLPRAARRFCSLVLVTQMFSPTALVVGLYREFFELGLVNTYAALILTNAAFNLAFAIWILRAFFASIPREIEEAAAVDGCGRVRTLVQVVLPLSLPGDGHRGDLRLHRRLERVHRGAHAR